MIDIRKLKELVKLMVENDLSEIDLRDEQETVVVRRSMGGQFVPMAQAPMPAPAYSHAPASGAPAAGGGAGDADDGDDESGLVAITSPMVGTFYAAPDPGSPPFVTPGSNISSESVVCVVEAMKVFSEIKADCSGTIERVLVKNGEPVEYGQKMFLVRPS